MTDYKILPPPAQWLIFTDLDGTLLDHHTYSHAAADPVLMQLRSLKVPVILNSSKTLAELEALAQELQVDSPLIAENGSVIVWPGNGKTVTLGAAYPQICEVLDGLRVKEAYAFQGFHDWSAENIAEITGLSLEAASRAAQRHASEPLLWEDTPEKLERFRQQLLDAGLNLKRGGRFWHVMGQADKVQAMQYLAKEYRDKHGQPVFVIALGDGPNDRDMLMAADVAVVVYNPDGVSPSLSAKPEQRRIHTRQAGPEGWAEAMSQLLHEVSC